MHDAVAHQNHTVQMPNINLKNEIDSSSFNQIQNYLLDKFQDIINLKKISEEEILALERKYFLELCKNPSILE